MLARDTHNGYQLDIYELRAVGLVTEIWVQLDMSFPEGDPRENPITTQEQIDYLLAEFENNIYPTDVEYFGTPNVHNGSKATLPERIGLPEDYYENAEAKNIIQISNIRDDNFYDYTYPSYIVGFFSSTLERYFDRNIINIDSYDWVNRLGPDVRRPFLYEGTVAHEYQHLIHRDYNPNDPSFMNEGCSMFAEPLCGYGYSWRRIGNFFDTPDNGLTNWKDQGDLNSLADYGAAQLWSTYLADQYGGSTFISHFVQAGIPGVEGINAALEHFNFTDRFDDVFRNWRIANLLDLDYGKYGYRSIDFDNVKQPLLVHNVTTPTSTFTGTSFGNTTGYAGDLGFSKLGSYGSDYIRFIPDPNYAFDIIMFNGDDKAEYGWYKNSKGWNSGGENLYDVSLTANTHVDDLDPYLRIDSIWNIEDFWDFAFVQISTDNGDTWTSLANVNTTSEFDPGVHPDIQAQLPGLTGKGDGIINFDLTSYINQDVVLRFRYMTDWGTLNPGWTIRSASVGSLELELVNDLPEADFMVTVVEIYNWYGHQFYSVYDIDLWDANEFGIALTIADEYIMIVSPIMEKGMTDYEITVSSIKCRDIEDDFNLFEY